MDTDIKKLLKRITKIEKDNQKLHDEQIKRYKHELKLIISHYHVLKSTNRTFNPKKIKEDTDFQVDDIIQYMNHLHDMNTKSTELIKILCNKLSQKGN